MTDERSPDPNKGGRDQYKRHIDGDITIRGQIETHVPPSAAEQHNTERDEDKRHARKNYVVGVLTLVIVVIYAGLTAWQGWLTRAAIRDAREHFTADQRPYVWNSGIKVGPITAGQTDRISADIFFGNYGKSPALNEKGRGKIFFGPNAKLEADKWFREQEGQRFGDNDTGSVIVLPPGVITDSSQLKPSAGSFTSIFSDGIPTADDVAYMGIHEGSIYIVHQEQYFDIAGNFYWSNMCWYNLLTKAVASCRYHNEIH